MKEMEKYPKSSIANGVYNSFNRLFFENKTLHSLNDIDLN